MTKQEKHSNLNGSMELSYQLATVFASEAQLIQYYHGKHLASVNYLIMLHTTGAVHSSYDIGLFFSIVDSLELLTNTMMFDLPPIKNPKKEPCDKLRSVFSTIEEVAIYKLGFEQFMRDYTFLATVAYTERIYIQSDLAVFIACSQKLHQLLTTIFQNETEYTL